MAVVCGLWTTDIRDLGNFEFASVPRAGDKVSLPTEPGQPHIHLTVERVVHQAAGNGEPCATFLFVAEA